MNRKLLYYTTGGILFVWVIGTLLHFCYEWSNNNWLVGLFCPVNESIWEHIKLLFFPMLLYTLFVAHCIQKEYCCAPFGFLIGLLSGCALIPVLYYTYTGILGFHIAAVDIGIFFVSTAAAFWIAYPLTLKYKSEKAEKILYALVFLLALSFMVFTFRPPDIPLFQPPVPSVDKGIHGQ